MTLPFQPCGYGGKVLRIDLSSEVASTEQIGPEMLQEGVGGVGYAARLLYDELAAGVDPLSAENKLVFATGPLTGTGAPGSGFGRDASVRECEIKDLGRMVEECYRARGWDRATGLPQGGKTGRL